MNHKQQIDRLYKLDVSPEAIEYAKQFSSSKKAWDACKRGDWMLCLLGRLAGDIDSDSRKKLVLCACKCARLSLEYVKKGEKRPLTAIQTAENWARGIKGVTIKDVSDAASAAYAASDAAYATSAAYAAASAAYAAYAASTAASTAASAAIAPDARTRTLKKCADIVRGFYPNPPN